MTIHRDSETYEESYDKLILAPGAKAIIPKIPGLDRAHKLPSVTKRVAGYGCYFAENRSTYPPSRRSRCRLYWIGNGRKSENRGLEVTVVGKASQVLPSMDEEMAAYVKNELIAKGIKVITGQSAVSFEEEGKKIRLEDDTVLDSRPDIIVYRGPTRIKISSGSWDHYWYSRRNPCRRKLPNVAKKTFTLSEMLSSRNNN